MSFELTGVPLFAGYVSKGDESCSDEFEYITCDFITNMDGDMFVRMAETFVSGTIERIESEKPAASLIDNLLAIIRRDGTATVYINETDQRVEIRPNRNISKGELVKTEDITDVKRLLVIANEEEVEIPPDSGILYLFSSNWRKGLFFDLGPLQGSENRDFEISMALGDCYSLLVFDHLRNISEEEWREFFQQSWFPFSLFRQQTIENMRRNIKAREPLDNLLPQFVTDLNEVLDIRLAEWQKSAILRSHSATIASAVNAYRRGDWVGTITPLFTRMEGIMREIHSARTSGSPVTQATMANAVTVTFEAEHKHSLLQPERFRQYLNDVYFANFQANNPQGVSRNTVSHGVVPETELTERNALIALLILDQLYLFAFGLHEVPTPSTP